MLKYGAKIKVAESDENGNVSVDSVLKEVSSKTKFIDSFKGIDSFFVKVSAISFTAAPLLNLSKILAVVCSKIKY